MKKVNCAAIIVAAMIGVGTTPAMASVPTITSSGVIDQIAAIGSLKHHTLAPVSNQQNVQQQQVQSGLNVASQYVIPTEGFAV